MIFENQTKSHKMKVLFQIFINNEFVNSVSGKTFPTINPANGQKICDVQEGDKVGFGVKPSKISNLCAANKQGFEVAHRKVPQSGVKKDPNPLRPFSFRRW